MVQPCPPEDHPVRPSWITYASRTGGHATCARAVLEALEESVPDGEWRVVNALDYASPLVRFFEWANRMGSTFAGFIWRRGFLRYSDSDSTVSRVSRVMINVFLTRRVFMRRFFRELRTDEPGFVLSFHDNTNCLFAELKRRGVYGGGLQTVITDHRAHDLWVATQIERYYVSNEETSEQLRRDFGVDPGRIRVTGIPIRSSFADAMRGPAAAARDALGVEGDVPAVSVIGGHRGLLDYEGIIESMDRHLTGDCTLMVVFGTNSKERKACEAGVLARFPGRALLFDYAENIADIMRASDVVVTKPGGVSTAEVLAMGTPVLSVDLKRGQELLNAEYVAGAGAGLLARGPGDVGPMLESMLEDRQRLDEMGRRARELGRVNLTAACEIASGVVESLRA